MTAAIDIRKHLAAAVKTLLVAALIAASAMALQRGFMRVSTAVDNAWATDSSWVTKGGWR